MIQVHHINNHLVYGILNLTEYSAVYPTNTNREKEVAGKNYLLQHLIGDVSKLTYDDKGKPYLVDDTRHISISHSHDRLVIILNDKEETGIDIELIREKVLKIKHKFLKKVELVDANDDVEKLLIYWAAKETLYKIYGLKEVDFVHHLYVKPFIKEASGTIIGEIKLLKFHQLFELHYQLIDNYVLVYATEKLTC